MLKLGNRCFCCFLVTAEIYLITGRMRKPAATLTSLSCCNGDEIFNSFRAIGLCELLEALFQGKNCECAECNRWLLVIIWPLFLDFKKDAVKDGRAGSPGIFFKPRQILLIQQLVCFFFVRRAFLLKLSFESICAVPHWYFNREIQLGWSGVSPKWEMLNGDLWRIMWSWTLNVVPFVSALSFPQNVRFCKIRKIK